LANLTGFVGKEVVAQA